MLPDRLEEVIFVGLPGPTHHYGGLSGDNIASGLNRGSISNPKLAALQALGLARLLGSLGIRAAILPPQLRPHMPLLRQHFSGDDDAVIRQAAREARPLLEKASSTSAMWTANAATVTPGVDCADGSLHITAANLFTNVHRRIEAEDTYRTLKAIFARVPDAVVHSPLSPAAGLIDEGAANHMRLSPSHDEKGLHVFVYGTDGSAGDPESARQALSASQAVKRQHGIPDAQSLFVRQNPEVIRKGVFHNDVIAVSNEYVLLAHEQAYRHRNDVERVAEAYHALHDEDPTIILVETESLSVEEAVHTYFFNSQIVTRTDGTMALIAPLEAQLLYDGKAAQLMERIRDDNANPIGAVHYVDLRQSMRNGGGPACLRLRVPMTQRQIDALASVNVLADERLLGRLEQLIERHYPDILSSQNLGDPGLYTRCRTMLAEMGELMKLPLLPPQ